MNLNEKEMQKHEQREGGCGVQELTTSKCKPISLCFRKAVSNGRLNIISKIIITTYVTMQILAATQRQRVLSEKEKREHLLAEASCSRPYVSIEYAAVATAHIHVQPLLQPSHNG